MKRLAALLATGLAAILLRVGTAAWLPFRDPAEAGLRLSWTARPERLERCRVLSAEELARELEHMRQRVECEGGFASYALRVRIDSRLVAERVVRGGGFRHDRPLHLLDDLPVTPGSHRLELEFLRRDSAPSPPPTPPPPADAPQSAQPGDRPESGTFAGRAERERAERDRSRRAAIPPRLALDTVLVFAPARVVLVTFDPERRRLDLRTAPPTPR